MYFGAHVSISGGLLGAVEYATSVGCECVQIFAKSPRQWRGPKTDPAAGEAFRAASTEAGLRGVFTHTAYLINLATPDPEMYEKSVFALADEIARGALLGADGVVTHVGASRDDNRRAAARRVGEGIVRAFDAAGEDANGTRLLLENTAGAGSTFGTCFEELAEAIEIAGLEPERLGVCIDTCHAFAYGYSLDAAEGWAETVRDLAGSVGLDRLGLVHANDCKFERGSNKDRHEWIGDGFIGNEGFSAMVCVPELAGVCAVTEMPGEVPEKDRVNVDRLKALRDGCAPAE